MYYRSFFVGSEDPYLVVGRHDLDDLLSIDYCETNIAVEMDALEALRFFPNTKKLVILPGEVKGLDTSFLKDMRIESLKLDYYSDEIDEYAVDLRSFPHLKFLSTRTSRNYVFLPSCRGLETLVVQEWLEDDLCTISGSTIVTLNLTGGRSRSLAGVESLPVLRALSISYQRRLTDVSCMSRCDRLEGLRIEKCPKVDLTALPALPELQLIYLSANAPVENIDFLKRSPKLRYCILDVKIRDIDLDYLKKMEHCVVTKGPRWLTADDSGLPRIRDFSRVVSGSPVFRATLC